MNLSFKEKYIIVNKGKICYSVGGNLKSETCLIFLNGLFHGKDAWIKQQNDNLLFDNYKMIFMNYRGIGLSSFNKKDEFTVEDVVSDIRMVIKAENLLKVNFVSFSVGGLFSLYYAYEYPFEVDKLILLNTGNNISAIASQMLFELKKAVSKRGELNEYYKFIVNWNYSQHYLEKVVCLDEIENYCSYRNNLSIFFSLLKTIENKPDFDIITENIKVPVLLIGGNKDTVFPVNSQKELYTKLSNCFLYILNNCGHASFIEKDAEVNFLIMKFITSNLFSEKRANYIVQSQV